MIWVFLLLAHSWYPPECCSDRDCHAVPHSEVRLVPGGYSYRGEFIPEAKARIGKDADYHVCFYPEGKLICFFKPYSGV